MASDTIFALSSGSLPSGVAVVRLSGPEALAAVQSMIESLPKPRVMTLASLRHPTNNMLLDTALVVTFPGPSSFTGEDCAELHLHGGAATVEAVLEALGSVTGLRTAEAGEFSRRAFENGKLDLTEVEGLSDLIAAKTERQRIAAMGQAGGALRRVYDAWRERLLHIVAMVEADLDFSEEEDVLGSTLDTVWQGVDTLIVDIACHLETARAGEIARRGLRVVLAGPPNAGKSSLLNAMAKRDVAIVTDIPGTTRDLIEVELNLNGFLVVVTDTAGIRDTEDVVEHEGIRRAMVAAEQADVKVWLNPVNDRQPAPDKSWVEVQTKSDLARGADDLLSVSVRTEDGISGFLDYLTQRLTDLGDEDVTFTRARHRAILVDVRDSLKSSLLEAPLELRAAHLRDALTALGRLSGRVDVEELLGAIFAEFCIGK